MTSTRSTVSEWWPVIALGVYTITAYGTWAYGLGVLLEPISADTGWSTSALGATFGIAMTLTGLGAFVSGRLLDRFGSLVPFGIHATVASGLLMAAFSVDDETAFIVLYGIGGGISGATGFYAITTVVAARVRADRPDRAIAVLTMIGAFSSPIYLPVLAWAVTVWPWRSVGRAMVAVGMAGALLATVATWRASSSRAAGSSADPDRRHRRLEPAEPGGRRLEPAEPAMPTGNPLSAMGRAWRVPDIRRMLIVYALAGGAASTVWVYQVPIMAGTGLALTTAGTLGGLRGFCQLFGRIGLTGAVDRFGSGSLLRGAYWLTALGTATLVAAGLGWFGRSAGALTAAAVFFALTAGIGLGASSPLQAIYSRSLFDPADLGLLMGMQGAVLGLAGGVAPFAGALLRDATGSWTATVVTVVVTLALGAALLRRTVPSDSARQSGGRVWATRPGGQVRGGR